MVCVALVATLLAVHTVIATNVMSTDGTKQVELVPTTVSIDKNINPKSDEIKQIDGSSRNGVAFTIDDATTSQKGIVQLNSATNSTSTSQAATPSAVKSAYELTEEGKICLLSPAASSYNVYKNFEEKGKHYKELIKKYGLD